MTRVTRHANEGAWRARPKDGQCRKARAVANTCCQKTPFEETSSAAPERGFEGEKGAAKRARRASLSP